MPEATTARARVNATIKYRYSKQSAEGQNGLVLLLGVLSEQKDPGDKLHDDLAQLAEELADAKPSELPYPPNPNAPRQIPAPTEHFTDRTEALAQLLTDLQPGRVVTLCGPGGIGKSALAAQALSQLELARFPDGIIWHNFYNQPQADLALENIARAFGEEPKPTPRDAALRVLANKRVLLFLDGTEDADNLGAVLAVRSSHCGALVTSRNSDDAPDEWQDIHPLETAQAVELLQAWGKQYAINLPAASEICKLVGGLPLAIRLVGRYLARKKQPAAEYLEWLQETPIEALSHGEHRYESVDILLARSLAQVSPTAQQILGVVGLLALQPFSRDPLAAALQLTANKLRQPLGELVSYGLLSRDGERYEVTHALIHTYARAKLTPLPEVTARVALYYDTLAEAENVKGLPDYRRLDVERAHLLRVLEGCHEQGEWKAVQGLVWAVGRHDGYLFMQGHMTERHTLLETGLAAARQVRNQFNEAAFLDFLATNHREMGRVTEAITLYEQALAIDKTRGDKQGQGVFLGNLGNAYYSLGQVDKAIEFYQQALLISREIGDRRGEGNHVGNLGCAYRDLGQVEQAIEFFQQALLISHEMGDRRGEGNRLGNLGNAYSNLGQVDKAIEFYQQALLVSREIGNRSTEAIMLHNLGDLYKGQGQVALARQHLQQSLAIFEAIKSPHAAESRRLLQELDTPPPP